MQVLDALPKGGLMLHKSFDILEAKADSEAGTFEATVAVFGNVDKIGDRIMPGAFKKTLARWQASGDPIPVILSHQWDNPMAHIGVVEEAVETEKGLFVKGTLDVSDNDVARQVHRLMKRRSLKEFSFGYSVPQGGQKRAKDGANDLMEIELAEIGPTLKGMNPATELHAVKSALDSEQATDPEELRKQATQVAREEEERRLPDVPDVPEEVKAVGPATRGHIENLVRYYASKPHPFTECVRDNTKRFGEDRAKRICATLKRMGGRKADDPQESDWVQELYDAADGDVEGLLEMLHAYMTANGDNQAPAKSAEELRRETSRTQREHFDAQVARGLKTDMAGTVDTKADIERAQEALLALEMFEPDEVAGAQSGLVKAVWTTAYINDLPDSAFLYVASGGSKDSDGKTTPRSLRFFPYKDANGTVDLPHLRNALSRIPQSSLPQDVKDRLAAKAQRILDNAKSVDVTDKETTETKSRSVDPLRRQADAVALEFASDGANLRKPPRTVEQPKPEPEMSLVDLKRRMRDEILVHLSGGTTST